MSPHPDRCLAHPLFKLSHSCCLPALPPCLEPHSRLMLDHFQNRQRLPWPLRLGSISPLSWPTHSSEASLYLLSLSPPITVSPHPTHGPCLHPFLPAVLSNGQLLVALSLLEAAEQTIPPRNSIVFLNISTLTCSASQATPPQPLCSSAPSF